MREPSGMGGMDPHSGRSSFLRGLGLIGWQPDWFVPSNQPWLAWLVTGGLSLFALAGGVGWLGDTGKMAQALKVIIIGAGFALGGWLFHYTPCDEFGNSLSLQNRI